MNRDESRMRGAELPPSVNCEGQFQWLGPRDVQSGGTWIAVNNHGVVACLLNGYLPEVKHPPSVNVPRSRGGIVPWLMAQGSADAMREALAATFDPRAFASFTVVVADCSGVFEANWRGKDGLQFTQHETAWTMFTSSSWNTAEVIAWRYRAFAEWMTNGAVFDGDVPSLHMLQPDGLAEWSPLMDRDRSTTHSLTQVVISNSDTNAAMRYWPRSAINARGQAVVARIGLHAVTSLSHD